MTELLESSTPWIEAALTFVLGALVAAAVASAVNLVMRRLLQDQRTAGRVGGAVFWGVVAVGFLVAVGRLAEPTATETGLAAAATRLLTSLPDLLIGLLVVVLGWAVAVAVRTVLRQMLGRVQPAADLLAPAAYWSILVLAGLIAADQIGIQIGLLRNLLLIVVGGTVLAAAIGLGLGMRPLVGAVVAGRHVDRILRVGDEVEVAGQRGTVLLIGHASVRLATDDAEVEVPHDLFLAAPVVIIRRGA